MAEKTHTSAFGAPLAGRSVVVTRARAQAGALTAPLEAMGAEVIAVPVIEIVDPPDTLAVDDALRRLLEYDWLVLTSANGVERVMGHDSIAGRPDALACVKVAAVGKATARRLQDFGIEPDMVPVDFRAEGLVEGFRRLGAGPGWRVLYARALEAREVLPKELRGMGVEVDVVPVYRTIAATGATEVLDRLRRGVDVVTFTSPSTVKHFLEFLSANGIEPSEFMANTLAASIGPVTTQALEARGFKAGVEAEESTVPALAQAVARCFSA